MAAYQYRPLNESAGEIRLLTLLPGSFTSDIHILIENEPLTKNKSYTYEALSYVWGTTDNPTTIYVGDSEATTLPVTQNLAIALRYLRCPSRSRMLWIDAISINQQDLDERSRQVSRMGEIYAIADRVVAWLGPEADNSSAAMKFLHHLGSNVDVDWKTSECTWYLNEELFWIDCEKSFGHIKLSEALRDFIGRSWFTRLWIRQEILLAGSNAILACGFDSILWQYCRNAIYCFFYWWLSGLEEIGNSADFQDTAVRRNLDRVLNLCDPRRSFGLDILHDSAVWECYDPRDRVYSALSLINRKWRDVGIQPDYTKSKKEVYLDVVLAFLNRTHRLDILAYCTMQDLDHNPADWPTWVPDWATSKAASMFALRTNGPTHAGAKYAGNGVLEVRAAHVVKINKVSRYSYDGDRVGTVMEKVLEFAPQDLANGSYVEGGTLFEAFCSTICCNRFADTWFPPRPNRAERQGCMEEMLHRMTSTGEPRYLDPTPDRLFNIRIFAGELRGVCQGHAFITTEQGHLGLAPTAAKPGDQISFVLGCKMPLVLRPVDDRFALVGETYVHGLMDSEPLLG